MTRSATEQRTERSAVKPSERATRSPISPRRLLLGRPIRHIVLAGCFVMVGGLVGVLPFATRSIQNDNFELSRDRLATLQAENAALEAQRDLLQSDEEVARIAREEFGLAPEDATIYAIPELRPENGDRDRSAASGSVSATEPAPEQSLGSKIVDFVVFWD
jgi:cell division protein FtsB